jgi:hypothetical protein
MESFKQCQRAFRNKYGEGSVPTKHCIHKLGKKLETTRSVLTQHTGDWKMSDHTVQDVKDRLLASPRKFSQETDIPYFMCQRAVKKAKLHPYRVCVVQELLPMDLEKRVQYCLWFQHLIGEHPGILDITWFTNEAWFHLSGYIYSQNTRVWAEENPHEIHTVPLHLEKIDVWCALSRRRIISPIFFHQAVTMEVYLTIFSEFVNQLTDEELTVGYFQQDGTTCHACNASTREFESYFDDQLISKKSVAA